ncbi:MAG: hypothetical protein H0V56_04980 [Chthoniobacterales bacterium]|nr:hypothetical protein [Chthoniobacterales bacterium]
MKLLRFALLAALSFAWVSGLQAQSPDFPGVQKAMAPAEFERAGLGKLSPDERAALDRFIRGYVASSNQQAATAAVDEAAKEGKITRNEPEVIQSAIVGTFRGYDGRTSFTLENGQVWKQSQQVSRSFPAIDSPPVLIFRKPGMLSGYRMYIAGGGNIRVSRVR